MAAALCDAAYNSCRWPIGVLVKAVFTESTDKAGKCFRMGIEVGAVGSEMVPDRQSQIAWRMDPAGLISDGFRNLTNLGFVWMRKGKRRRDWELASSRHSGNCVSRQPQTRLDLLCSWTWEVTQGGPWGKTDRYGVLYSTRKANPGMTPLGSTRQASLAICNLQSVFANPLLHGVRTAPRPSLLGVGSPFQAVVDATKRAF
jgi:hypothetical protein